MPRFSKRHVQTHSGAFLAGRRRLRLEQLCQRQVLASISGFVFDDANMSFSLDEGETGLEDRLVYLDLDMDGRPGLHEPIIRTDADGRFQFDNLAPGEYVVRLFDGSQAQQQTYPLGPVFDADPIDIQDAGQLLSGIDPSTSVFGIQDDQVFRIDSGSGEIDRLSIPGVPLTVQALPDGRLLVLQDPSHSADHRAWLVSFDDSSVLPVDFGNAPGERGWSAVALNSAGQGVLLADADDAPSRILQFSFVDSAPLATPTDQFVDPQAQVRTSPSSDLSVIGQPSSDGIELSLWSNNAGTPVADSSVFVEGGVRLEAFSEALAIAVVRTAEDELLVLDTGNSFALLHRLVDIPGPVVIHDSREGLFAVNEMQRLVMFDLSSGAVVAELALTATHTTAIALSSQEDRLLVAGHDSVQVIRLDQPTGHRVVISEADDQTEQAVELLFGLHIEGENLPPAFSGAYSYQLSENGQLVRHAPELLARATDDDPQDHFIVLRESQPSGGNALVGPNGDLRYWPAPDFYGIDQFEVVAHDGFAAGSPTKVWLTVLPQDQPLWPFLIDVQPIPIDAVPGQPLGPVTILLDPQTGVDQLRVLDPRFDIQNGQLVLAEGMEFDLQPTIFLDFEAFGTNTPLYFSATVMVTVDDGYRPINGLQLLDQQTVPEAETGVFVIGTLEVLTSEELDAFTFELSDPRFEVVDSQLRLRADQTLGYDSDDGLQLQVTVHAGPHFYSETFTISVSPIPLPPPAMVFSETSILERVAGVIVGEVHFDGPNPPSQAVFSVDDSRFEFVGTTLKLRDGIAVRYTDQQSISLTLTAVDESDTPYEDSLTVQLDVVPNDTPFHNQSMPADVDGDGRVDPFDALLIINYLNRRGPGPIQDAISQGAELYYDVNGDGMVTPLDALLVINHINRDQRNNAGVGVGGEGPSPPQGEDEDSAKSDPTPVPPYSFFNPSDEDEDDLMVWR